MFGSQLPAGSRATAWAALVSGILVAGFAGHAALAAAANVPPGVPNFEGGEGLGWHEFGDLLLPPPSGPGPVTEDPKTPFNFRLNYRVADTSNPILQPWAAEQMRKENEKVLAGGIGFRPRERCLPGGVPEWDFYARVEEYYFLQTPAHITMMNSGGPEIRRVYLNVPHSKNVKPTWYGESVGHYEGGDTLVVDTIGLSAKSFVDDFRTPHTDQLHVVERFKMSADHKNMETLITVDDPGAFTRQWSATQRFDLRKRELTESPCAENNENFFQYDVPPMPTAGKPDF